MFVKRLSFMSAASCDRVGVVGSVQAKPDGTSYRCFNVLFVGRAGKTRMVFRMIPSSMTLNGLERRNSPYFAFFFTEFDSVAGRLCHSG